MKKDLKTTFMIMGMCAAAVAGVFYIIENNSPENTIEALAPYNLSDIKVGGFNFFCVDDTPIRRHFEARNDKGEEVEGEICAGRVLLPDSVEIKKKIKP